jgi:hypothetical protein
MPRKIYSDQDWQNHNMHYPGRKMKQPGDHWTESLWTNKKFLKATKERFGCTMFSFAELKKLWYDTHPYWHTKASVGPVHLRDANKGISRKRSLQNEWLKATVGNFIGKAIYQGDLIRICPGWYMLPLEYEGEPDPSKICCENPMILTNWGHHTETGRTVHIYACTICGSEKEIEFP